MCYRRDRVCLILLCVISIYISSSGCIPDSKVHGANMGSIWGRQNPGGPMLAPWTLLSGMLWCVNDLYSNPIKSPHKNLLFSFQIPSETGWKLPYQTIIPRPHLCIHYTNIYSCATAPILQLNLHLSDEIVCQNYFILLAYVMHVNEVVVASPFLQISAWSTWVIQCV